MKLPQSKPITFCLTVIILLASKAPLADDPAKQPIAQSSVTQAKSLPPPPPGPYRNVPASNEQLTQLNKQRETTANNSDSRTPQARMASPTARLESMAPPYWMSPALPQRPNHAQPPPVLNPQSNAPPGWAQRPQYTPAPNFQPPPNVWQQYGGPRYKAQQSTRIIPVPTYPLPNTYRRPGSDKMPHQPPVAYWQRPYWKQRPPIQNYRQGPTVQWPIVPPPQTAWRYGR